MSDETADSERATPDTPKVLCKGCGQPLDPEEQVYAGFEHVTKPSSTGKGTYQQRVGPSVTHPAHWPPMGGDTHDASPEWPGLLKNLPDKYRA